MPHLPHIKCFCLDLLPEFLGEEAAIRGYAFSDGVWQVRNSLTSLCAMGTLSLDYRNVVSLGFALQKLRWGLWCVICPGLETDRLQSAP